MKRRRFSHFVFGIASFIVKDGFPDEFIEYCSRQKIIIYNLRLTGNEISGSVHFADILSLTEAAEKCGMQLEITGRSGLPHIICRYKRRYGIPAGLLLFTVITAILHSVLWSIDITPTEIIPRERITEVLNEAGARVGVFTDTVDCKEAEYLLYDKFDDISWVNVRIAGTRMFVSISEVKKKEKLKKECFSNIVALKDGEIINAQIFKGDGKIYPGTAVVKGDLLVSGIKNHFDGSVEFVDSEAQIYARTKSYIASRIPSSVNVKIYSKCKDIYLPVFFGISPAEVLSVKTNSFTESAYYTDIGDVILPIGIKRIHKYTLEDAVLELTENEASLLCFRDFSFLCMGVYEKAEILESDISLSFEEAAELSGSFLCIEDIAHKKEFTVEDISPSR